MESAFKKSLVNVMDQAQKDANPGRTNSFEVGNLEGEYSQYAGNLEEKDARDFEEMSAIPLKKKNAATLGKATLGKSGSSAREKLSQKVIDSKGSGDGPKPQTDSDFLDCPENTRPHRKDDNSGDKRGASTSDSHCDDKRDNTQERGECPPEAERRASVKNPANPLRGKSMYCHLSDVNTENINMRFLNIDEGHLDRFRMGGDNFEFELQVLMKNVLSNQFLNVKGLPRSFGTSDIEWFLPGDVTPLDKLLATQGALVAIKLRDSKGAIENMEHFEAFTRGMNIGSLRVESTCQRLLENNIRMMSTCSMLSDKAQSCVKSLAESMRRLTDSTERSYATMQGMSREVANLRVENKESGKQQAKIMPGQSASSSSCSPAGASAAAPEGSERLPTESASDILKRMAKK